MDDIGTAMKTWVCQTCGAIVQFNEAHSCPNFTYSASVNGQPCFFNINPEIVRLQGQVSLLVKEVRELKEIVSRKDRPKGTQGYHDVEDLYKEDSP